MISSVLSRGTAIRRLSSEPPGFPSLKDELLVADQHDEVGFDCVSRGSLKLAGLLRHRGSTSAIGAQMCSQPDTTKPHLPETLGWSVLKATTNPVWLVDETGLLLWNNQAGAEYLNIEEISAATNLFDLLPPDKAQHRRLMLNAVRRTGREVDFVDHDGNWWEINIRPTECSDVYVFWQRNVDRRVVAEEDLRRSLSRAMTIQEDERRRISRDLHDETGQALTGLILELRGLARQAEDQKLRERADNASELATSLMRQMRTVLHQLNPPSLKTKSLDGAMTEFCSVFSERTGIRVIFEADNPPGVLNDDYSTTLYRLLQEGLTNIARHAEASTAWVSLSADDEEVTITVEDDGNGFDDANQGGSGLLGIRERFAMLDGQVEIEATLGRGVRLEGTIPLKKQALYGEGSG